MYLNGGYGYVSVIPLPFSFISLFILALSLYIKYIIDIFMVHCTRKCNFKWFYNIPSYDV